MSCDHGADYSTPPCDATEHTIPCQCTNKGPIGDQQRRDDCNRLGLAGEWTYLEGRNINCSPAGYKSVCGRVAYKGNVENCCLNPGNCFSTDGGTCPPDARSYMGKECQLFYLNYCGTSNLNELKDRWSSNGACRRALESNALAGEREYVSDLGTQLLGSYFHRGAISEDPSELQDLIYDICHETPLACSRYLEEVLCPGYKREDLTDLTQAKRFCGCYLNETEYITDASVLAGIPKQCDSICVSATNIRPVDSFGNALYCDQSICIIDNVAIDLIKSNVGEINFSQLCGDCGAGSCVCIIKDVDITAEDSDIGGINLEQECGSDTRCYQTASNGEVVEVDCDLTPEERRNQADEEVGFSFPWRWVILGLVLAIILIFIIIVIILLIKKK